MALQFLTLTLVPVLLQLANPTRWSLLPSSVLWHRKCSLSKVDLVYIPWQNDCRDTLLVQDVHHCKGLLLICDGLTWGKSDTKVLSIYHTCEKFCLKLIGNCHIGQGQNHILVHRQQLPEGGWEMSWGKIDNKEENSIIQQDITWGHKGQAQSRPSRDHTHKSDLDSPEHREGTLVIR